MAIDWGRLQNDIIEAAVVAVNGTLTAGLLAAQKDVPVRKVFSGGRQTVRFKTAAEIEGDKDLRKRLGLGPELLATPAARAAVKAAGINPKSSTSRRVPIGLTDLHTGAPAGRDEEFGFARTISHPARGTRKNRAGLTRAGRGLVENRGDRANPYSSARVVVPADSHPSSRNRLADRSAEFGLSARGRYELRSGRAISQRKVPDEVSIRQVGGGRNRRAEIVEVLSYTSAGQPITLGGGLRDTLRLQRASASTFPDIEGRLLAGDAEHKYAIYQELGTRRHPAHPFLRPRLPEWREELPAQLLRSLRRTGR